MISRCSHNCRLPSHSSITLLIGDPVDKALLRGVREARIDLHALRRHASLHDEFTFDTIRKRMTVIYNAGETFHVVVKGAPEAMLASGDWLPIIPVALLGTFWMEARKLFLSRR